MKKCKLCNEDKKLDRFYKHKQKGKNGQTWHYYDCYCKPCRSGYQSQKKRDLKIKAMEYLGGCCYECGLIDDPRVYDFHHLDPNEKEFSLGSIGARSFNKIKSELDKCVLLCANCHRKKH